MPVLIETTQLLYWFWYQNTYKARRFYSHKDTFNKW